VMRGPGACQSDPPGICRRSHSSSATSSTVVLQPLCSEQVPKFLE
jgi:hypothetical protein